MYPERYRKAAVAEYFDKGKNASQVAPHYNVHVSTLLRWVEKECGAPVPEKHHRGKYAGKLSVDDVQYSKRAASKYPIKTVTESVNARRAEDGKGPVCDRTVRRAVQGRKHPMKALLPMKSKPVSTANRRKRIVYCSSKAALVVQNRVYVDSKTFTRASYAGQSKANLSLTALFVRTYTVPHVGSELGVINLYVSCIYVAFQVLLCTYSHYWMATSHASGAALPKSCAVISFM